MELTLGIDWAEVLPRVAEHGSAYMPGALGDQIVDDLLAVELPWRELDDRLSTGVNQQYTFASLEPAAHPSVDAFCRELSAGVRAADHGRFGLDQFAFNELGFHRYNDGDLGITRHRDMDFYRLLIVGITLAGSGELHLFDEHDQPTQVWQTQPGDVYAFRAPGLAGCIDGRPRHATGPTSGRTSLTLRFNEHGYLGGWDQAFS